MSRPSSFDDLLGALNVELYGVGSNGSNGSNGNGEVKFCDCDELIIDGKRQPMPKWHNCAHVKRRNDLIPEAERIATGRCGKGSPYAWTRVFVAALDSLVQRSL